MNNPRFDELFSLYAQSKGFVPKTGSPMYVTCLARFECFQAWYQDQMGLTEFEKMVVDCKNS